MTIDNSRRIADMADDDRPREKALRQGIRSLTDTELLAIVIGSGMPGKSVIDLSREIYASCHNRLDELSRLTIEELCSRFTGVGPAKAVAISAALELGHRAYRKSDDEPRQTRVRTSEDAYRYIRHEVENLPTEEFWILLLNRSNSIKHAECVSRGGTDGTVVDTKIILKRALDHLAQGIILVHNHPSGNLQPSPQDDALTRRIADAARLMEITVLDHLIITHSGYYSYTDNARL